MLIVDLVKSVIVQLKAREDIFELALGIIVNFNIELLKWEQLEGMITSLEKSIVMRPFLDILLIEGIRS